MGRGLQAMSHINTIFNQLLQLVPEHQFENLVNTYAGDYYVKNFTCWKQFKVLLYAQIKGHDSLRDIETSLNSQKNKLYHLGLGDHVAKSTLADANDSRDWRIFEGVFYYMLERCIALTPSNQFKFKNPFYTLDSTLIQLCLSMFPWGKYRKTKGALKMHCLLENRGCIPSFITITEGARHDVKVAKELSLPLLPDSIIALDRAYVDFEFLYSLDQKGVYFVTRAKKNQKFEFTGLHEMPQVKALLSDTHVIPAGFYQKQTYPKELRLIEWHDKDTGRDFCFLTNNFTLAASTIAAIYKARWNIESFFKWIKQNLKIKSFLGTSINAVLIQIFVAMCYYLLLTYIKYQTRYGFSITHLDRVLSAILMERTSLIDILSLAPDTAIVKARSPSFQLSLF
jgi:hypothetical protein